MKKRMYGIMMALTMTATLLAGCGGAAETKEAPQTEEKKEEVEQEASEEAEEVEKEEFETAKIKAGYMPNLGSAALYITAEKMGYFEEMGLEVETTEFQSGPPEIAAMASGDIQICQIGHGAHALCAEGQAQVFQIVSTSLADAIIGNKEKGVESIEDLKGKKVAISAGTSAEAIFSIALENAGMSMDDVETVEMDTNGMVSAMVSGSVDACATWAPNNKVIEKQLGENAAILATNAEYVDQVTFPDSFATTKEYAEQNHDVLVRFTRAIQKAMDYRSANIEEVAKWTAQECEADEQTMLNTCDTGNWITSDFVAESLKDGTIRKYYENQQKVFLNSGRLTQEVSIDDYIMFDIMQEAYDANQK